MMEKSWMETFCGESGDNLLEVRGLTIYNQQGRKERLFLDDVNFKVKRGQFIALVGRSGIGKTLTIKALLGLLEEPYWKVGGNIIFYQRESFSCPITGNRCVRDKSLDYCPLEIPSGSYFWTKEESGGIRRVSCPLKMEKLSLFKKEYILKNGSYNKNLLSELIGKKILTVFQGADTHLNPYLNIGWQIGESINPQKPWKNTKDEIKRRLREVQLETDSLKNYPYQFSGGMRQRAMIAMALICTPKVLIADEPTTALDVTIQAQIIDLVKRLREEISMSIIWITHDLGIIAGLAERVLVMYAGYIVEKGPVKKIYSNPQHPYTIGLLGSLPKLTAKKKERLVSIDGLPPVLLEKPNYCPFAPRCPYVLDHCWNENPPLLEVGRNQWAACWVDPATGKERM